MKANIKLIINKYNSFFIEISGFISASLIFSSGIGRYRICIAYAVYSIIKAIGTRIHIGKIPDVFLLPAIAIAIYLDVTKGPLLPLFTNNYFMIALPVLVIVDLLISKLIKHMISYMSNGELFVACPSCSYDNRELVKTCKKCNYDISKHLISYSPNISMHFIGIEISPKLFQLLDIDESEEIVYHKKLTSNLVFFKNNERELRKHLIISTANVIFIDYEGISFGIPKSYRAKDMIPLGQIELLTCEMKNIFMANCPFLEIVTIDKDCYGITFSYFGNFKDEMEEIVKLITNLNPQVKTTLNI